MGRELHSVNGKIMGAWYETATGNKLYLAHRVNRQIHRVRNAWCVDLAILEKCRTRDVTAIGIIKREKTLKMVWLSLVEDFFGDESFAYFDQVRQRGLPLNKFRVDPLKSQEFIESFIRLPKARSQ